MNHEIHERH